MVGFTLRVRTSSDIQKERGVAAAPFSQMQPAEMVEWFGPLIRMDWRLSRLVWMTVRRPLDAPRTK